MIYWLTIFLVHFLSANKQITSDDLVVKVTAPEVKVDAGKSAVIHIMIAVKEGYHIQANKVRDEFLIPTTLEINSDKKIITRKAVFPPAKKYKLEGTEEFLKVFDGNFEISIPFKTQKNIERGKYMLHAKLHYQACDSRSCLFPKIIDFNIPLQVL